MKAASAVVGSSMTDVCRVAGRTLEHSLADSLQKEHPSTHCFFKDVVGTVGIDASSKRVYWEIFLKRFDEGEQIVEIPTCS